MADLKYAPENPFPLIKAQLFAPTDEAYKAWKSEPMSGGPAGYFGYIPAANAARRGQHTENWHEIGRAKSYMRDLLGTQWVTAWLAENIPTSQRHLVRDSVLVMGWLHRWLDALTAEWEANPRMLVGRSTS